MSKINIIEKNHLALLKRNQLQNQLKVNHMQFYKASLSQFYNKDNIIKTNFIEQVKLNFFRIITFLKKVKNGKIGL